MQPSLSVTGVWLAVTRRHRMGLPVFHRSPLPCMPTPLPRRNHWVLSLSRPAARPSPKPGWVGFRNVPFRGLLSVHSRFGLHVRSITRGDLYTEYFNEFVTSFVALVASGRATDWPGVSVFHGRNAIIGTIDGTGGSASHLWPQAENGVRIVVRIDGRGADG